MRRILVTGGMGFIGSHFVTLLSEKKEVEEIVVLDAMTYAADKKRLEKISGYRFYQGDINDTELVIDLLEQYHITELVHFAAESHVDRSLKNANVFYQTNVMGTISLLEALKQAKEFSEETKTRFLFVSTDEVYGSISPNDNAATEITKLNPQNPYAASKAAAEQFVHAYENTYQIPTWITRSSNNYGIGQHNEKFIPTILNCLEEDKPIPLYGKGAQMRNWISVSDHCMAIYKVLTQGKTGEIYNIKGRETFSNKELIHLFTSLFEEKFKRKRRELISFVEDREGHDFYYHMSDEKFIGDFSFQHQGTLKDFFEEYCREKNIFSI